MPGQHPPSPLTTRIIIEAVPQEQQRYDTLGDWFWDDAGNLVIRVTGADPFDQDEAFLIALHELIEVKLCAKHGITQGEVDAFDLEYDGERDEPGDDPAAPYQREHRCAMMIEHTMAMMLGLWSYGKVE